MTRYLKKILQYFVIKEFGSYSLFSSIRSRKDDYITITPRPKNSESFTRQSDNVGTPPFAIIIQGRSVLTDFFTEETIKIYQKSFSRGAIIFSSHVGADSEDTLERLRKIGARVVISPKPEKSGPFNINLQTTSSAAGLKEAKKLGFKYAIKTRSDVRLYGVNIEEFLFNLMKTFPLKPGINQHERIISTNIFTLKYRPYSLSDMTVAGDIDDLLDYFSPPLDQRDNIRISKDMEILDFVREKPGEIYLETEFLIKKGEKIKATVEDSWRVFAERFCVVDHQSLDSYWYKSEKTGCLENKFLTYGPEGGTHDLNFREWFNLYNRYNK